MSIRPYHDRILVSRLETDETSAGGIVIPDTAKEKPQRGKVLAIGEGKALETGEFRAMGVQVGEVVLFGKYAGTEVKQNGEDLLVIREDDVMGVITE